MSAVEPDTAFPEAWIDLRTGGSAEVEQRAALQTELAREVGVGHVLRGRAFSVVARSEANDDVLLTLDDDRTWALVHLTWQPIRESARWPRVVFSATVADAVAAM